MTSKNPDILFVLKLTGKYEDEQAQRGSGKQVIAAGNAMVKASEEEVSYLTALYPNDLHDVKITSEQPLALMCDGMETAWQIDALIDFRGEDIFEFCPFTYDTE